VLSLELPPLGHLLDVPIGVWPQAGGFDGPAATRDAFPGVRRAWTAPCAAESRRASWGR